MNPMGFSLLYMRRNRKDHRSPLRREDEEPLHFMVSNGTYRLVLAGERGLKWWLRTWERDCAPRVEELDRQWQGYRDRITEMIDRILRP